MSQFVPQATLSSRYLDTNEYILPGDCATYPIDVTKNFDSGDLVFVTPGAPDVKPEGMDLDTWRKDNWVVNLWTSQMLQVAT